MNYIKHIKIESWYLDTFPGDFGYVAKNKKKGFGLGHKTIWELRELREGAWHDYFDYLLRESKVNFTLTLMHMAYLDLIRDARAHNDPDDLEEFKETIKNEIVNGGIPAKYLRKYLKLQWSDVRDDNVKRLEMDLAPTEMNW